MNLENSRVISQLKTGDSSFVSTDKEILNECEHFFKNLYSFHKDAQHVEDSNFFFENSTRKTLDSDEKEDCEGLLTKAECLQAAKNMEPDKTPGSDGLPADFYKVFWNDISDYLVNSINYAFGKGQLSLTQRRGIIKLIPEKDAEPDLIRNWRPITLLNCDYKIAAKAVANRLKKVIPKLVNSDQTGFIKGRFIGENVRLIDCVISFAAAKNIPGLLLFLDFEKAFDSLNWSFIQRTFKHFNFGSSMINWVKTFYNNIESCVLNNGWSSNFFNPERGVRQGCPLSPYLFILCVEVLAEKIRNTKDIKDIFVNESEIKISQYADDTTLILDGSKKTLAQVLERFRTVSGLKLNNKKTEVLWIGANTGRDEILCPEKNLKWVKDKVKALGVWFSTDPKVTMETNYSDRLTNVNECLGSWEYRRLSLLGKITVLKSLIVSKLVYILSPLPTNYRVLKELSKSFFHFLWSGKGHKVKRNVMIGDYSDGGLKMIDLESFNKALKSTWVKKYLDPENHGKWKYFFDSELQFFGGSAVFRGNLKQDDLPKYGFSDLFIMEILQIWSEVNFNPSVTSLDHYLSSSLWHNSLIKIDNRPIFYKSWYAKGVEHVAHLMKDSTTFEKRFGIKSNFLAYQGLISALKSLKQLNKDFLIRNKKCEVFHEQFLERPTKWSTREFVSKNSVLPEVKKNGLKTASSRTT